MVMRAATIAPAKDGLTGEARISMTEEA